MNTITKAGLLAGDALDGRIFSNGWRIGSERITVLEPATGDALAEVGAAADEDVRRAATSAAAAQVKWAARSAYDRARLVLAAADVLESNADEVKGWIVREAGSVPAKADVELGGAIGELREAASLGPRARGEVIPDPEHGRMSMALRVPIGVVGVITPWNFPLILAMRSVAPALALGNAVVLKCDPRTPVCGGLVIARAFEEAGLPEGLLHVLPGDAEAGAALCEAPEIGMVSFTGSTAAGRKVGAACGANLKKVVLELGGKNPFIVCEDADVDAAASSGAWGSFLHQGQICMAVGRHIVHESVAEQYLDALVMRAKRLPVGNPATEQVALGPIIDARQLARVQEFVNDSRQAGAEVLAGGDADGPYFPPTVLGDVKTSMRVWNEEVFGPVAPIVTFSDDDEAVALANDTDYGLSAGIYTASPGRGRVLASRIRSGMAHIGDQSVYDDPRTPFGGVGASGNGGRFGGDANLDEFTQWRWISERDAPAQYPF